MKLRHLLRLLAFTKTEEMRLLVTLKLSNLHVCNGMECSNVITFSMTYMQLLIDIFFQITLESRSTQVKWCR